MAAKAVKLQSGTEWEATGLDTDRLSSPCRRTVPRTIVHSQGSPHSRGPGGTYLPGFICVRNRDPIGGVRNVIVRLVLVNILETTDP